MLSTAVMYPVLFLALYIEVFFLMTLFWKPKGSAPDADKDDRSFTPSVTIVVPCWNEERTVAGTMSSLLSLDYPHDKLRVVVVDDGSTDRTLEVARTFAHDPRVQIISKVNGGKFTAINKALLTCTTDLIGCLDADSFVAHDALRFMVSRFKDPAVHASTPGIVVANARNILTLMQRAEYAVGVTIKRAYGRNNSIFITPGPFSIFRTTTVQEMGGWRHAHGSEDLDIALRLQEKKLKIVDTPQALVYTTTPDTLKKLYKQRVRWSYGYLMNAWDYRHLFFNTRLGVLSMVLLPSTLIFIAAALYTYSLLIMSAAESVQRSYFKVLDTGLRFPSVSTPHLDWFYIDTSPVMLLSVILLLCVCIFMVVGKQLTKQKIISVDTPLYFMLYGFIVPLWLTGSVVRALTNKQAPWR
jgi:cellulose synthase/poly-beta-1,6-N-acetylglucosamine synthase-like glycosyltransferase